MSLDVHWSAVRCFFFARAPPTPLFKNFRSYVYTLDVTLVLFYVVVVKSLNIYTLDNNNVYECSILRTY